MQLVFRSNDILEAHIVAGLLETYGIVSHVGGYYLQGAIGDIPITDIGLVYVEDGDVHQAKEIIHDYESKPPLSS